MKTTHVLFATNMAKAVHEGNKTQTRRIVKGQPPYHETHASIDYQQDLDVYWWWWGSYTQTIYHEAKCPYGKSGDQLWVKETFYAWGRWETRFSEKKKRDEWHFIDLTLQCGESYRYADCAPEKVLSGKTGMVGWWKRPSIFMPRVASRILLEISAIRVERLNDISDDDAIAEGAKADPCDHARRTCSEIGCYCPSAKNDFQYIWDSINGKNSWQLNPWVWVVTFKKIEGGAL